MKALTDLLTLAILIHLIRPLRQLPLMLLHGVMMWAVLLGSVIAILDYEARTAGNEDSEQTQYQDESQPARVHLTHFNPPNP